MEKLLAGLSKFQNEVYPSQRPLFEELARGQQPSSLFITCCDSRVDPLLITQSSPGEIFVCRNVGNMVPAYGENMGGVSATIEYAVVALKVKHVVVLGHSDCGAMKGVLHPESVRHLPLVDRWLRQAECAKRIVCEYHKDVSEHEKLQLLIQENVIAQLESVMTHPGVAVAVARNELQLYGLYYNIASGQVSAYDPESGQFAPLQESVPTAGPRPRTGREKKAA